MNPSWSRWQTLGTALADLLLPALCPACEIASGPKLCPACQTQVESIEDPCRWCAAPGGGRSPRCAACDNRGLTHIHRVHVACVYRGVVERLVSNAKAGGRAPAGRALTNLLPDLTDVNGAVVVPVPPSPGRRNGPHLGTTLARAVAQRHGLELHRSLSLTRLAAEQHRLSQGARARNVADLFLSRPVPQRVVLVDDLITSGATASAAAAALRHAGAKEVVLVCVARTPHRDE